jgi:hypothetical protein
LVYRAAGTGWAHVPSVHPSLAGNGGDLSKLRYWGLVVEFDATRDDGGRPGLWRITDLGERFVLGRVTVPSHAVVFLARLLRLDGDDMTVRDALGERFDYDELMAERFAPVG